MSTHEVDYDLWADQPPDDNLWTIPGAFSPPLSSNVRSVAHTCVRRIGLASACFGPGACIEGIFTDAESPWIKISNLPREAQECDVMSLVTSFGIVQQLELLPAKDYTNRLSFARILFDWPGQASNAAHALHGQILAPFPYPLIVRLDTDAEGHLENMVSIETSSEVVQGSPFADPESTVIAYQPRANVRDRVVKVTWFAPRATAYATYPTANLALRWAKELNGRTCGSFRVTTEPTFSVKDDLRRVGRENAGYVVRFRGLVTGMEENVLRRFTKSQDVAVQQQYSLEDSVVRLREDLSDVGPLESFRFVPHNGNQSKCVAFAEYTSSASASAAMRVFADRRAEYFANSPVHVERRITVLYELSLKMAEALQGDMNRISSWARDDPGLVIRQRTTTQDLKHVELTISGASINSITQAKVEFDRALKGETLCDSTGHVLWNSFFTSREGVSFLQSVATSVEVCMRIDRRTRSILVFGPPHTHIPARDLLQGRLAEISQLLQKVTIPHSALGYISRVGLRSIQTLTGNADIRLSFTGTEFEFPGDDETIHQVTQAIDMIASEEGSRLGSHSECSVCLCNPEDMVLLPCGHQYCSTCFLQYIKAATRNRNLPLVCVGQDCKEPVPLSLVFEQTPPEAHNALLLAAFQDYISGNATQYRYCPTPNCQNVYRIGSPDTSVMCKLCLVHTCTNCHVPQHDGMSCAEYLARYDKTEGQRAFDRWRDENDVKECPTCGARIQKLSGCNHLVCSVCHSHLCWVCLDVFTAGPKVYDHMRQMHGAIGL